MRLILGLEQQPFAVELAEGEEATLGFAVDLYIKASEQALKGDPERARGLSMQTAHTYARDFAERMEEGEQHLIDNYDFALAYVALKFLWDYQVLLSSPSFSFREGAEEIGLTADELVDYSLAARHMMETLDPIVPEEALLKPAVLL